MDDGIDATTGAFYIYPQPPADGLAHSYVVLLYQQPLNWTLPTNYSGIVGTDMTALQNRYGFDAADFQQSAGLNGALVGTNYFRVLNGTAEQSSSLATATMTGSTSTIASVGATTSPGAVGTGSATSSSLVASHTANAAADVGITVVSNMLGPAAVILFGLWLM